METTQFNTSQSDFYAPPPAGNEPPMEKRFFLKIIVPIILLISAICIIAGIVLVIINSNPKLRVMKAFAKTFTVAGSPLSDYIGADDLKHMLTKGNYRGDLSLWLDDMKIYGYDNKDILTVAPNFTVSGKMSHETRKASVDLSAFLGTMSILNTKLYADETNLAIACPDYFDHYLQFETTDIDTQFNQSVISDLTGIILTNDLEIALFNENTFDPDLFLSLYKERYPDDLKLLYRAVSVRKTLPGDILIDGQSYRCPGYELTVPSEQLKAAIVNMLTLYAEVYETPDGKAREALMLFKNETALPDSMKLTIYLDPKSGVIAEVLHEADYSFQKQPYHIDMNLHFPGGRCRNDTFKALFCITDASDSELVLELSNTALTEGYRTKTASALNIQDTAANKQLFHLTFHTDFNSEDNSFFLSSSMEDEQYDYFDLSMNGSFSQVKKSEQFTYEIDDLRLSTLSRNYSVNLSGTFSLGELTEEVESPKGTALFIFRMNEEELNSLLTEIQSNSNRSDYGGFLF